MKKKRSAGGVSIDGEHGERWTTSKRFGYITGAKIDEHGVATFHGLDVDGKPLVDVVKESVRE